MPGLRVRLGAGLDARRLIGTSEFETGKRSEEYEKRKNLRCHGAANTHDPGREIFEIR